MHEYLLRFVSYCKNNGIWFAVDGDGTIDECHDCERELDFSPDFELKLGHKDAYEWLVNTHSELVVMKGVLK